MDNLRLAFEARAAELSLLEGFFHSSSSGMVILDRELRLQHFNQTLAVISGLTEQAHLGRTLGEAVPPIAPSIEPLLRSILETGQPQLNIPIHCDFSDNPDLSRHWITSHFPIFDKDGQIQGIGGVIADVTERIRAESALHEKTAELKEAQRLSQVGSWEWRPDTDTLKWSPELFRIAGLPSDLPAPRKHGQAALYSREGWGALCKAFKEILAGGSGYEIEFELLRPDGNRRWVITRAEAERDAAGNLVKIRGTMQDITERKQAENRVRDLANEVMDLYQNAPCGYHSLDADGRFVQINDTELNWLGYLRDQLIGQKFTQILTSSSKLEFTVKFPLLRLIGRACELEQEMVRADGSILPVLVNSTAIFDEQGRFVMSRATTVNMTERNRLADERRQQEERQAEISRHLIDIQEDERRRLAVEVHDVVSPNISAIQIILGIIEMGLPQQALKHVGGQLQDIRQLIQDTNGRLRQICANLRPSLLDYAGLYSATDNYRRQLAERTGLTIELSGGEADGRLPGNVETLLFRIVQEALVNCSKHAQASHVTIELTHDSQHAYLEINDDGIGFDVDDLTAHGHKSGLGLLTMAERAEFAGGRFRLESKPGHGTRIIVEI